MRNRRLLSVSSLVVSAAVALPALAGCTTTSNQITQWEMNEPAGATVMKDTGGVNNINGTIGKSVQTATVRDGKTGYGFPFILNGTPTSPTTVDPQHLVTVPNDNRLNPGTGDYVAVAVFRHVYTNSNVVEKGQAGGAGGYWKIETHENHVTCFFEGSTGVVSSIVSPKTYNDNKWHTYRCERKAAFGVRLSVDGVVVGTNPKQPGNISNNWPLVIGGKTSCNNNTVECDYFAGQIDRVALAHA